MSAASDRRLILVCLVGLAAYMLACLAVAVFGLPRSC